MPSYDEFSVKSYWPKIRISIYFFLSLLMENTHNLISFEM